VSNIDIVSSFHENVIEKIKSEKCNSKGKNLRVLLLTIPFSIPAGAAIMPQRLFYGLLRKGVDAKVITHWWDCGFEPLVRYSVISKEDYRTFFRTRDLNGNRLAEVKSWKIVKTNEGLKKIPAKIKVLVSRKSLIETSREVVKEVCDYLLDTQFKPDIVHIHTHTFMYDGTLHDILQLLGNPPVVYTLHAVIKRISKERERAQRETVKTSNGLITISEGWKKAVEKLYGRSCAYIHNATDYFLYTCDKDVERRAKELYNILNPERGRLLLFSGRIEEIKVEGLPKAFSEIAEKWNVKLIIVGDAGGENSIKNLVRWGLKKEHLNRVIFVGWINGITESGRREIAAYYKMLNLDNKINGALVMPVKTEDHYGLSVLDAIAMKAPVITCKGKLATYGCLPDPESLVKAIEFVFSNPEKVREKVEKSYNVLKKEYSVDEYYVPKHLEFYYYIMDERKKELKNKKKERIKKMIELIRKRKEEKVRKLIRVIKIRKEGRLLINQNL